MSAFGAATEFQGHGTPHLHAEGHIVSPYQFGTLHEIAQKLEKGLMSFQECADYQQWFHREDPLDDEEHKHFEPRANKEWTERFATREHDGLSRTPEFMTSDPGRTLWNAEPISVDAAAADARQFKSAYFKDARFIFSRVQHHVHKWTKNGYVPLKTCKSKSGSSKQCHSEGFLFHKVCFKA